MKNFSAITIGYLLKVVILFISRKLNIKMKQILLIITSLILSTSYLFAQEPEIRRFTGSIVAGINGSQIDGDARAGYNKVGLSVGARAGALLAPKWELAFEILFSQQGATERLQRGAPRDVLIHLNCIEVPVLIYFKDWEVINANNVKYHRVYFGLGASFNRLLGGQEILGGLATQDMFSGSQGYKKNYVMLMGDVNFYFTRNWAFNMRWGRAPMNIKKNTYFKPHMFTLRGVFTF